MKTRFNKAQLLVKNFGVPFAVKYCFYRLTHQDQKYINMIYRYLSSFLSDKIEEYNKMVLKPGTPTNNIWICWWQGYDAMPDFCKMCYENLKRNTPEDYSVHLITQDNYSEFVSLPAEIVQLLRSGKLSVTQFSDLLRQALIAANGGVWIDASVWVTEKYIELIDFNAPFWSVKLDSVDDESVIGQVISQCKWSGFALAGCKDSLIFKFVYECMCKYFLGHTYTIDYFIQNMIIRIAYDQIESIHEIIEKMPVSNRQMYELYRWMDQPFDDKKWKDLCSDTSIFKLTQKRPYNEMVDGKITFYGHLKEAAMGDQL